MSLYGALFAGVSGIKSQGNKIGIISDNIANVNTVGFKQNSALFETLVVNASSTVAFSPGGAIGGNRQIIDKQGLLQSTDSPTDIALSGSGFFVVSANVDGSGQTQFTRAGSFRQDNLGNFVNAAGFFLQGWPLDREGRLPGEPGNLNTISSANLDSLQTVNIESASGVASATTTVEVGANLDAGQEILAGQGDTITMDQLSTINFGIQGDDIIAPDEVYNLAPTNNIARGDAFTVATGNGLTYDYNYGGFTVGRDVTVAGAGNVGDAQNTLAPTPLAGGEINSAIGSNIVTVTLAGHGLVAGQSVTIAGAVWPGASAIPAAEINTTHVVQTVIGPNQFTVTTTTAEGAAPQANGAGGTIDNRQYIGNVLDATTASEIFLGTTGTALYTTAARTFTVNTATTGTVTFTYVTASPSATSGQFNNLTTLANAIDEVVGLTARVVSGRLIVGSEDANEAVTFANGDATGSAGLAGIDWVTELDLQNVAVGTRRFSTLSGLTNLVNADAGVTAVISNQQSNASVEIRVDDPLDTIRIQDFLQTPVTNLPNDPANVLVAGGPGNVTVQITDTNHGLQVGNNVTLAGLTAFGGFALGELNATHTITNVVDANTYEIVINAAGAIGVAAGGGAAGTRQRTNVGSILAEFGMVTSLNGGAYVRGDTGILGPRYDASEAVGLNLASSLQENGGNGITPHFSRNVRVFDSLGAGHDLQVAFVKIATNRWAVEIFAANPTEVSSTLADSQIATGTIEFNGDGTLRSVTSGLSNPINVTWTNGSVPSTVTFDWGTAGLPIGTTGNVVIGDTNGLSQFDADYNVAFINQNGAPVGELISVNIDEDGFVIASFSNGETQNLFKLPVADFANPLGLDARSGNVYTQTRASGEVNLREAGTNGTGTIVAAALEQSNVELSEQLTDLIVAQRSYQSNTRAISVSDELLEELNRL